MRLGASTASLTSAAVDEDSVLAAMGFCRNSSKTRLPLPFASPFSGALGLFKTASAARWTVDAGATRGAVLFRCEEPSDRPEAAATTPDASPPRSATTLAKAFTTRRSRFSRKVRLR